MKPRFDVVVFDLDGTVIDSHAWTFDGIRWAVAPWNVSPTDQEIHDAFGPPERVILQRFVPAAEVEAAHARLLEWTRDQAHRARPHEDMPTVLETLARAGVQSGLFTGRGQAATDVLLDTHGLRRHFEAMVTGDAPLRPKPSGDGIHWLLRRLQCEPQRMLVVGDSILDIQAAQEAGVVAVGVSWFTPVSLSRLHSGTLTSPRQVLDLVRLPD